MKTTLLKWGVSCILFFSCVSVHSQQMITISQNAAMTQNVATLEGKAGVVFVANSDDMVITTNINKDPQSPKAVKNGKVYRYEMVLDISGTKARYFTVTKYGTTNSQKTGKIMLSANKQLYFDIEQVENGIDLKIDPNQNMGWINGKKGEALIEFNSKIKLNINCPNLKHTIRSGRSMAGTYLDSLIFDATQYTELAQKENELTEELEQANKRMNKEAETMDDATYDALKERIPKLTEELNKVSSELSNLLCIEVFGEKTNKMVLDYNLVKGMSPMSLLRYNVLILNETIIKEETFDEILATAKNRYNEYPQHTDFNFYDGTMAAYKKVLGHKQCPDGMRPSLQVEYDSIVSMRKWVNFYERGLQLAQKAEPKSKDEYKYLLVQLRSVNHLLDYHPEISGFKVIRDQVKKSIGENPNSKYTVKRQRVSGKVSFADAKESRPFNSLKVYASPSEKIDRKLSDQIGNVNTDGTYSVLIPDNFRYIYVTGEKKAHYIGDGRDKLDIEIK